MNSSYFVKKDLREETVLRCPECLEEVETCDECDNYFFEDPVYCDQTGKRHLCEVCFDALREKEVAKV